MQSVGFQSLAIVFARDAEKRARAEGIDGNGDEHHSEGPEGRFHVHIAEKEPPHRFPDDPRTGGDEQAGLDESGKVFNFAVPKGVLRVRGYIRNPHRNVGDRRRDQVQAGVHGLGKNSQAAGPNSDRQFQCGQQHRRPDGSQGDSLLLAAVVTKRAGAWIGRHSPV